MSKNIITVVGARPQLIKASAVSRSLEAKESLQEYLVHTGQHFDDNMSGVFFRELGLSAPDAFLGIHGGGHGDMTGRMLIELEALLLKKNPDLVLVYGDTNSTLAGAIAAAKLGIPVGHVEAGLRSFNRQMPEELNRVITDHVSDFLFAPTTIAVENLSREGVSGKGVSLVGDVMYDVALAMAAKAEGKKTEVLAELGVERDSFILATVHRAGTTDNPDSLLAVMDALEQVASDIPIILPLHPRTRARLTSLGRMIIERKGLRVIDPVGYLEMVVLERAAAVVVTDSGGVQKEAFFHGTPCVTLRNETEWVELVDLGWNRLVSPVSVDKIREAILGSIGVHGREGRPYGDGAAAEEIAKILDRVMSS